MARGLGNSSPVMDKTQAKADRATAKTEHRHAGPYGASAENARSLNSLCAHDVFAAVVEIFQRVDGKSSAAPPRNGP